MAIGRSSKLLLVAVGAVGLFLYAVIVDVGISAGRIHRGVRVHDLALGGLTEAEAADAIAARGRELASQPLLFVRGEVECEMYPAEVGWRPRPFETAHAAMRVGRDGLPFGALWDRVLSWVRGVEVRWVDKTNPRKVGDQIDLCEARAFANGMEINRGKLRYKIRRALSVQPRKPFYRLPLDRD